MVSIVALPYASTHSNHAGSPFVHRVLRALVEVEGGAEEARAVAQLIPDGIPQLWHGCGAQTWKVISAVGAAGIDVEERLAVLTLRGSDLAKRRCAHAHTACRAQDQLLLAIPQSQFRSRLRPV